MDQSALLAALLQRGQSAQSATNAPSGMSMMLGPLAALAQVHQAAQPQSTAADGMNGSFQLVSPIVAKMRAGLPLSDEDHHALMAAALMNPLMMGATAPDMPFNPAAISRSITKQLGAKLYDKS
jgi:hypothetical protein